MVRMPKESSLKILLSLNAVAILIAGIAIASAIFLNGGVDFRAVDERSDTVDADESAVAQSLIDSVGEEENATSGSTAGSSYEVNLSSATESDDAGKTPSGELWAAQEMTIYATADTDICVDAGLSDLGEMYWQSNNSEVIEGFYDMSRTWLGYDAAICRYPKIVGTGTVTVTAGTYDGARRDSIEVTVVRPPAEQWKKEVLSIVNNIRANNNLSLLSWGATCEEAAETRAREIMTLYSHTRPDGSSWATACPVPVSGGKSGENLAMGNAAVSPLTVVMLWMGSDSHRENILSSDYTKMAVGFVYDPDSKYKTYWSEEFSTY